MSETIKVSKQTKQSLTRVAARLQEKTGKRVDFDEAIRHLLAKSENKPELLDKIFGSVPRMKTEDLYSERRLDEKRFARRHSV